ncbi:MAG TPA: hypothetical protein ENK83_01415 [Aliiroseovarius sp.]|nr:hypothetical protein [Aliiroseovarius sp.]
MADGSKTECRTPTPGRDGATRIPTWKFDALRAAILDAVGAAGGTGLPFADLPAEVATRLDDTLRAKLGSVSWHTTTVKLELEVRGELARLPGSGPQRLVLA